MGQLPKNAMYPVHGKKGSLWIKKLADTLCVTSDTWGFFLINCLDLDVPAEQSNVKPRSQNKPEDVL